MDEQARQSFGRLIAALRRQQINPLTSRPFTQSELAEQANVGLKTLRKIEQGTKINIQVDTLKQLADTLQLTTLEQQQFFALSTQISLSRARQESEPLHIALKEMEEELRETRLPAMLYDSFYHVVAINHLGRALYSLDKATTREWTMFLYRWREQHGSVHMLVSVFHAESPVRLAINNAWEDHATLYVHQFRAVTLPYRQTKYFQKLLRYLFTLKDFDRIWAKTQQQSAGLDATLKRYSCYCHPAYGKLCYRASVAERITSAEGLYISTVIPNEDSTADVLGQLRNTNTRSIERVTSWPHPALLSDK